MKNLQHIDHLKRELIELIRTCNDIELIIRINRIFKNYIK